MLLPAALLEVCMYVVSCDLLPVGASLRLPDLSKETKVRDDDSAHHNAGVHGRQPSFDGTSGSRSFDER